MAIKQENKSAMGEVITSIRRHRLQAEELEASATTLIYDSLAEPISFSMDKAPWVDLQDDEASYTMSLESSVSPVYVVEEFGRDILPGRTELFPVLLYRADDNLVRVKCCYHLPGQWDRFAQERVDLVLEQIENPSELLRFMMRFAD